MDDDIQERDPPTGGWFSEMLSGMLIGRTSTPYAERKIARDNVSGLIVSTAWTDDLGFETAVLDARGTYPVERYTTRALAVAGHATWLAKAPSLSEVVRLGTGDGVIADKMVTLLRRQTETL